MNQEEKWREEFEKNQWLSIEMDWSFPLGSHHKKLVRETALNIYIAARKKAQEEIEHLNIFIKEMKNTKATIALCEALKENEKRDRLLAEANKLIKKSMMKNKDGKIEWLKQYEEMRLK